MGKHRNTDYAIDAGGGLMGEQAAEQANLYSTGLLNPNAPMERRIRELEDQVAALEAARMPHVPTDVDPVIRALVVERLRQGKSQRDVVHALECSSASVSQWERGVSSPTLGKLRVWAEALSMSLNVVPAERTTPPGSVTP